MGTANSFPYAGLVSKEFFSAYRGLAHVDLFVLGPNRLELSSIFVEPVNRGKGYAGEALRVLTVLADKWGVELSLEVGGQGAGVDGDLGLLCEFYGRYGFCFDDSTMVRAPSLDSFADNQL
jgi:GNAT superfamily N-acetyltransferase